MMQKTYGGVVFWSGPGEDRDGQVQLPKGGSRRRRKTTTLDPFQRDR